MKAALHKRDARGRTASGQATNYAARLMAHAAEFMPFLQRLAVALGRIYRPDQNIARIDESSPPRCEVWWPTEAAPCCMGRRHATTAPTEDTARVLSVDTAE